MAVLEFVDFKPESTGLFDSVDDGTDGTFAFVTVDGIVFCEIDAGEVGSPEGRVDFTSGRVRTMRFLYRPNAVANIANRTIARIRGDLGGDVNAKNIVAFWDRTTKSFLLEAGGATIGEVGEFKHDWSANYADGDIFLVEVSVDDAPSTDNNAYFRTLLLGKALAAKVSETQDADIAGPWDRLAVINSGIGEAITEKFAQIVITDVYKDDTLAWFLQTASPTSTLQAAWDGSDGNQVDNHLLVDEMPPNGDTDYISTSTDAEEDIFHVENPNLPLSDLEAANPVLAVQAGFQVRGTAALGLSTVRTRIRDANGVLTEGTFIDPGTAYTVKRDNAFNGTPRTKASADDLRVGVEFDAGIDSDSIRCSGVWLQMVLDGRTAPTDVATGVEGGEKLTRTGEEDTAVGVDVDILARAETDVATGVEGSETLARVEIDAAAGVEGAETLRRSGEVDAATGVDTDNLARTGEGDTATGVEGSESLERKETDAAAGIEGSEKLTRTGEVDTAAGVEESGPVGLTATDEAAGVESTDITKLDILATARILVTDTEAVIVEPFAEGEAEPPYEATEIPIEEGETSPEAEAEASGDTEATTDG